MTNQQRSSTVPEGVYANGRMMHTMTSLVGNVAQIVLKDGSVYEGVLKTFSPKVSDCGIVATTNIVSQLDVVLECAIEVDKSNLADQSCTITSLINSLNAKKTMVDTMIFEIENIVSVGLLDVDMDYAFKDGFKTDTEISGMKNAKVEKELVAWVDDTPPLKRGVRDWNDSLEPINGQTGWSAQEMFAYNEKVNGVLAGYTGLDNVYTTAINRDDPGYQEKQRIADALAKSIGNNRTNLEDEDEDDGRDGRDEESKWSGVSRNSGSRAKEPLSRSAATHAGKKPSDGNWRDTNLRLNSGEKLKPTKSQQEPFRQYGVKNQNQGHSPKSVVESHNFHTELSKKSSNPPISRTPSKEQVENSRPISFAAAVGQSEFKSGNQIIPARPHQVVAEAPKAEPVDVPDVQSQEKFSVTDAPKSDPVVPKKSDAIKTEDFVLKTSKLNPNAKEFTLNPTAKPFTPKSHFSPPPQPLIANHPANNPQSMMAQTPFQPQQQVQPHQQPKHHQQASQYLVMNPQNSAMVMPQHQQVIGPNGQPFQLLNSVVLNQMPGNHNSNQYNPGYNQGGQPRKSHHGPREPRQGSGHTRHDNNNSYNPHNVAAATGHPVLAGAPLTASGPLQFNHHHQGGPPGPGQPGPGGQPMFSPMFVQGYPRMFQPQMINPYDPQYFSEC